MPFRNARRALGFFGRALIHSHYGRTSIGVFALLIVVVRVTWFGEADPASHDVPTQSLLSKMAWTALMAFCLVWSVGLAMLEQAQNERAALQDDEPDLQASAHRERPQLYVVPDPPDNEPD